jgi:hypothetical protein
VLMHASAWRFLQSREIKILNDGEMRGGVSRTNLFGATLGDGVRPSCFK